jgi:hypothetical protein
LRLTISAWWTSRSTIAATATASLKISAQALKGLVGADDQAGVLVAAGDQREEQGGGLGREGDVADLVADQQRDAAQPLQLSVEPPSPGRAVQPVDPLVGGGEGDAVAGLTGPDA